MYRFAIPEEKQDYYTTSAPVDERTSIPYVLITAPPSEQSGDRSIRILIPVAAAEESKFFKKALEGLRGMPGYEAMLLSPAIDSSPSMGGGGGIRSQWKSTVETTASKKYAAYVERYVFSNTEEDPTTDEKFKAVIKDVDDAEEEETFYGQTVANRRYPPASMVKMDEEDAEEDLYVSFCSNSLPRVPTFPMKTISNTTMEHLAFLMMKRALYNTKYASAPFDSTTTLLSSLGASLDAKVEAVDLMIASTFLQI